MTNTAVASNQSAEQAPGKVTPVINDVQQPSFQTQNDNPRAKWWKFQITDEQARAWQNGDVNAAKQFYNENERFLKNIARHYYKRGLADATKYPFYRSAIIALQKYEFKELLSQIYADMMDYRFWDSHSLYRCIMRSCLGLAYGGYVRFCKILSDIAIHTTSLDAPIGEDGEDELIDVIADSKTIDDYLEQPTTAMSKAFESAVEQLAKLIYPRPQDELKRLAFIRRF